MSDMLDMIAQRVYLALELVSDVGAASLSQHVQEGKPGSKLLADDTSRRQLSPAEAFKRRYDGCVVEASKRAVISDGLAEIKAIRYSRHPSVDCQTLEGRLTVGRDTRPAPVVAYSFGYSVRHIHTLRAAARRHDERHGRAA